MNDSAPPPHGAPPHVAAGDGQAPLSWQGPAAIHNPEPPQAPAFDPRRAIGGPASHAARQGTHPVMAPPPMRQDNLASGAPSPYAAPSHYDASATYPGPAPHLGYEPQAAPPYPAQPAGQDGYGTMAVPHYGHASGQQDPNYGGQPGYAYPTETTVEPAGGRASLMSRLTGRTRRTQAQAPEQNYGQNHDQGLDNGSATASARKPFLMGLLTGVVVMLILGQVFRASSPSDDYAQALPPTNMTITDGPVSDDPKIVAFLDTVEGLN